MIILVFISAKQLNQIFLLFLIFFGFEHNNTSILNNMVSIEINNNTDEKRENKKHSTREKQNTVMNCKWMVWLWNCVVEISLI